MAVGRASWLWLVTIGPEHWMGMVGGKAAGQGKGARGQGAVRVGQWGQVALERGGGG